MTSMPPSVFLPDQFEHEMPIPLDNGELARATTRLAGHINAAQYRFLKMLAALVEHKAWEFRWHYGEDGMLEFKGKLPPEQGAVFLKAIDLVLRSLHNDPDKVANAEKPAAVEDLPAKDVSAETSLSELSTPASSYGQRRADALAMLAEHALQSLDQGLATLTGSDKYQVIVHIEADKLTAVPGDAGASSAHSLCSLEDGPFLSPQTARRLACDSGLLTVLEDSDGELLNVGRKTRTISPAIRRALNLRDHGCRFPGCCQSRFTDGHHIQHWCDGGETRLDNLILLCRYHHRLLHNEGYAITKDAKGDFVFHHADGQQLRQAIYPQFIDEVDFLVESLAIENEHQSMGMEITSRTAVTEWQGEVMDYGLAVGTLLKIEEQRLRVAG